MAGAGLLERLVGASGGAQAQYGPGDDFWYRAAVRASLTGIAIDAERAMEISAVFACQSIFSDTIGTLPLFVNRMLPNDDRIRERRDPRARLLHSRPNRWQTSVMWRAMMQSHAQLRGNGYSEIILGRDAMPEQLIPLHPDRVEPKLQDDGRIVYKVKKDDGTTRDVRQELMFHLPNLYHDGIKGIGTMQVAREAMGLAKGMEEHGARFFSQNAIPGGALRHPGVVGAEGMKNLRESWRELHGGLRGAHEVAVLEEGMEWQTIAADNEKSQWESGRHLQVAEIARFYKMPLMMLQEQEKSTTWGSGIEQFSILFVTHTIRPWAVHWEQVLLRDLFDEDEDLFPAFNLDGLLRGDQKSRYEAYQIAAGGNAPFMTRNELRRKEDLNALDSLDEMLQPLNMGQPGAAATNAVTAEHLRLLAHESAGRLVRKEIAALARAAKKHPATDSGWRTAVGVFYAGFAAELVRDLLIAEAEARIYCNGHAAALGEEGAEALQWCEAAWTDELARLALRDGGD